MLPVTVDSLLVHGQVKVTLTTCDLFLHAFPVPVFQAFEGERLEVWEEFICEKFVTKSQLLKVANPEHAHASKNNNIDV